MSRKLVSRLISKRWLHHGGETRVAVLGAPFRKGQPKQGVEEAPKVLRERDLIGELERNGHCLAKVTDYGDVQFDTSLEGRASNVKNMRNYVEVIDGNRKLSEEVSRIIRQGDVCLTIGGDHSIGLGTVHGHMEASGEDIAVLWVDAHADLNTNLKSGSGNMHGMPLGLLAKELEPLWDHLPDAEWLRRRLPLKNLAYVGLRSVDAFERETIRKYNVTAFGMQDVDLLGIEAVMRMALQSIDPRSERQIHVSFDVDSMDVVEAPSTGTPVRGGLSLREAIRIMEIVHETGRMRAMDLVEVNPRIGTESEANRTIDAALQIVLAAFGHKRTFHLR